MLRNREAVRKYRERKKATLIQMEEELAHLRSENGTLKDLLRTIQVRKRPSPPALLSLLTCTQSAP